MAREPVNPLSVNKPSRIMKRLLFFLPLLLLIGCNTTRQAATPRAQWTPERAKRGGMRKKPWAGSAATIRRATAHQSTRDCGRRTLGIRRRLTRNWAWAHDPGFSRGRARVFFMTWLWKNDKQGLLNRMEEFLSIASKHKVGGNVCVVRQCVGSVSEGGQAA